MTNEELVVSAKEAVFATPELLEAILLHLVPDIPTDKPAERKGHGKRLRHVLLTQRVSQAFKSAIEDSPELQQALFFCEVSKCEHMYAAQADVNPLIQFPSGLSSGFVVDGHGIMLDLGSAYLGQVFVKLWNEESGSRCTPLPKPLGAGSWQRMLLVVQGPRPSKLYVHKGRGWEVFSDGVLAGERVGDLLKRVWPERFD